MDTVQTEDVLPVRSRISWGAILAGAVVALAVYFLLSALGVALGLSVTGRVGDNQLAIGAVVWAVATLLLSLFIAGCVTSQCSVGESRMEAVIYGVILWGVLFAALVWMMTAGVKMGFSAVMGIASTPAAASMTRNMSDEDLKAAGFTEAQIAEMRSQFDRLRSGVQNVPAEARAVVEDSRTSAAAWWTFGGILLSMIAAGAGAVVGAGPQFVLARWRTQPVVKDMRYSERQTLRT